MTERTNAQPPLEDQPPVLRGPYTNAAGGIAAVTEATRQAVRHMGVRRALRLVDTNAWTRRNFARWMFEDEPRAIALTPHRWHRRLFTRPGPFAN